MATKEEESSSDSSEDADPLNMEKDEGWEDVEPDVEDMEVKSFFDSETFSDVRLMLQHCRDIYDFDFLKIRDHLDLDFLETVKLVNYIRSEAKVGNIKPDLSKKDIFEDQQYLQPVLADDALLYSLDDLEDALLERDGASGKPVASSEDLAARNAELVQEVRSLQKRCALYQDMAEKALEDQTHSVINDKAKDAGTRLDMAQPALKVDDDSHYFKSYAYNEIHETMLKDTIRTDAYRDFIYLNKHLFQDRVILDVGCGTGILSMLCARAGAKKVYAVDNSDIINKARENVFENGLGDVITCIHGKIEEITLPVGRVDVLISEWMGYCLLYEAMLDSVLWARDHFLVAGGLMVPSHTTLHIAPLHDPDFIAENISFWNSVYGFSMNSMLAHAYDEVLIRDLKSSTLPADSQPFLHLPLHHTLKDDLTFVDRKFSMTLKEDIDSLDGFVIWFDTFFAPSSGTDIPATTHAENWASKGKGIAFTTGPGGPETHWRQGILLIDHSKQQAKSLKRGQILKGSIDYQKRQDNAREIDIQIQWDVGPIGDGTEVNGDILPRKEESNGEEKGKQLWSMR